MPTMSPNRSLPLVVLSGVCGLVAFEACVSEAAPPGTTGGDAAASNDGSATNDTGGGDSGPTDGGGGDTGGACAYAQAVLADSPIHYFRFTASALLRDEIQPGAVAAVVKNGASATSPGAVSCADDGALATNDTLQSTLALNGAGYGFTGRAPYSVELWIKPGAQTQAFPRLFADELIVAGSPGNRVGYALVYASQSNGSVSFGRFNGPLGDASAQDLVAYAFVAAPTTFRHVVGTYDGTVERIYVDGDLQGQSDGGTQITIPSNSATPMLGGRADQAGNVVGDVFTGAVDELAIYDHALSAARIQSHFGAR